MFNTTTIVLKGMENVSSCKSVIDKQNHELVPIYNSLNAIILKPAIFVIKLLFKLGTKKEQTLSFIQNKKHILLILVSLSLVSLICTGCHFNFQDKVKITTASGALSQSMLFIIWFMFEAISMAIMLMSIIIIAKNIYDNRDTHNIITSLAVLAVLCIIYCIVNVLLLKIWNFIINDLLVYCFDEALNITICMVLIAIFLYFAYQEYHNLKHHDSQKNHESREESTLSSI